jgi:hypothetical protein
VVEQKLVGLSHGGREEATMCSTFYHEKARTKEG